MHKKSLEQITVTSLTAEGEGIGCTQDGHRVIVKGAIPGDVVVARIFKPGYKQSIATVETIITPSTGRIPAKCPITAQCGACQLQIMAYPHQLETKRQKVVECFKEAGLDREVILPTLGMEEPWHYRNKSQLPIGKDARGHYISGFFAARSHQLVPQDNCLLVSKTANKISKTVLSFLEHEHISLYDETSQKGLLRYLLIREGRYTGQWLVCLVINGRSLPKADKLVSALKQIPGMASISLSVNPANTNVIMGKELLPLFGPLYIKDKIGSLTFRISPLSFFQINPLQTKVLYDTALRYAALTGREEVWDLYCGAGTISLFLAQNAKLVRGVEVIPEAIDNARDNARLNGLENSQFYVGKAEEVVPQILHDEQPGCDVVVVDPPRKGCEHVLLETILKMAPQRIVYVSCNPETLARDLAVLVAGGTYKLQEVQPVDLFPQTSHIETVALLVRN